MLKCKARDVYSHKCFDFYGDLIIATLAAILTLCSLTEFMILNLDLCFLRLPKVTKLSSGFSSAHTLV